MDKDTRTKEEFLKGLKEIYQENSPRTQLTVEDTSFLLGLLVLEKKEEYTEFFPEDEPSNKLLKDLKIAYEASVLNRIIYERLKAAGKEISVLALFFLNMNCNTPGLAVIIANYVFHKTGLKSRISLLDCVEKVFPWGFWSDEQEKNIWNYQKRFGYSPDNWLDYKEAWETSIF